MVNQFKAYNDDLSNIKLIIYDFDGVMTDNKVYVDQNGNEMVQVSRADGLGVSEIKKLDIKQVIISTEKNPVVLMRAKKLGINCFHGIDNKKVQVISYCEKNNIDLDDVVYIGNDINDKEAMGIVGKIFCPSDAHPEIKKISNHILKTVGGSGVIREFFEIINSNKGD